MNNNKLLSLVILLVSFMVLIFFTKDYFYTLQSQIDTQSQKIKEQEDKKAELEKLNKLKADLEGGKNDVVNRYAIDFKEDEIVNYIYSYLEETNGETGVTLVKTLTMTEGTVNEFGFKEAKVILEIRVSDEAAMMKFLDFLTSPKEKYNFFIESFSYPNDGVPGSFNVTVPLKIFYK